MQLVNIGKKMNKILRNILGPNKRRELVEEEDIKPKKIIPVRRTSLKEVHQEIINEFKRYYPYFLRKNQKRKKVRYSFNGYKYNFRYTGVAIQGDYHIRSYLVLANRRDGKVYELKYYANINNSKVEVDGPL